MEHERFFGLHFDFHANNEVEIGENTNIEDIEKYIKDAKPDFIQCDCKGHPGNSCYPTKVGKAADKLKADNLRVWVDAAKKNNTPIYVHYSGIWDAEYLKKYPEDAALYLDNDWNIAAVSMFSNYLDKLMIPQIKELITEYDIDGMWVDGDCWAVQRDYSECAKPYLWEGITHEEHDNLMKETFFKYLKKYVDELHNFKPDFKITSNWMYSSYVPEKPEIAIDFISGDYHSSDSAYSARYEGRCMAAQNMPWDLMAWGFSGEGFHGNVGYEEKNAKQLMQEAAVSISLGGGFQVYMLQNSDGSARRSKSERLKELGEFMRARRMCYRKTPVAQVGIFYSVESRYKKSNIFNQSSSTKCLIGALNCVLDTQYTANVILEYQIDTLSAYDVVLVPEWEFINNDIKNKLLEYAKCGGNLLIIGAEISKQFGELTGDNIKIFDKGIKKYIMDDNGEFAQVMGSFAELENGEENTYFEADTRYPSIPAYSIKKYGNGKVSYIPFNLGTMYCDRKPFITVNFLKKVLNSLKKPIAEVNKSHIDITMQKIDNGYLLNLVNMSQSRHELNVMVYDEIPEICNVEITLNKEYKNITMPFGEKFEIIKNEGKTVIKLERLDIHSIILLEE